MSDRESFECGKFKFIGFQNIYGFLAFDEGGNSVGINEVCNHINHQQSKYEKLLAERDAEIAELESQLAEQSEELKKAYEKTQEVVDICGDLDERLEEQDIALRKCLKVMKKGGAFGYTIESELARNLLYDDINAILKDDVKKKPLQK